MKSLKSLIPSLSLLAFLLASLALDGQQYLYLKKKGEVPAYRWEQGAPLELKVRNGDEEFWLAGDFVRADSNRIVFGTKIIRKQDIVAIKMDRGILPFLGNASMSGAVLFTGVILVNGIINNDKPIIRTTTVYISLGFLAGGYLMKYLGVRKYYMKDGWYFEHIDFNEK